MSRLHTLGQDAEVIDLQKLYREARQQWYIDSGRKAEDDRLLYEAFCRLIDRAESK